jgi:predicted ATPase/class 3 adenylate cyclase
MIALVMRQDLPTGTVTFLFTDVEGSTSLLHELGAEAYAEALAKHRQAIRSACSIEGGVEVDTQGDAFFFAFPTAQAALVAAGDFTERLTGDGPVRVRVGLHTGSPHLADEGYVGDDVHFAARVAASAHGGQVVLSAATAELVDLPLTDLGEHRLKDIDQAVSIFQLGATSFPPLKTISNTNLPRPASSFVGRQAEVDGVRTRLGSGARLVTLTGPGGTGKTRLALEAASMLVPSYKAGVFWVGLSAVRDPALVTGTITQVLGAKDSLAKHIGERDLLLLLDNLEQVIECAPELATLLERCPNLTLLVTSRELLRVRGEVEYPVPPLASPEAVALFCERAELDPSEDIAALCARLDNLPLAVELAAARTKALAPAQILARLSQRLDLLKGGRDADPRQLTLRATIEWSHDLLSDEERLLFRRFSVFDGGCALEAAEEVCDADLDSLQSLVEKSLLRFTVSETGGRYWMLETIREYAGERLEESREADELRRLHARCFVESARGGMVDSTGPLPADWVYRFEPERPNLRAALTRALSEEHAEDAYILAIAYSFLCRMRGPIGEGRSWLAAVLALDGTVAGPLRQRALRSAAALAELQRDHAASRALAEESLAFARSLGDPDSIGAALLALGVAEGTAANFQRAEALEREALALFSECGDERHVRATLGLLAWIAIARSEYAEAQALCERALLLSREAGDDRGVVLALGNLGHCLAKQGYLDDAFRLQCETLGLTRDLLDIGGVADTLVEIASIAIAHERYEKAAVMLGTSAALRKQTESAHDLVTEQMYEEALSAVQAAVQMETLASATTRGHDMSLDEIVAYAVGSLD